MKTTNRYLVATCGVLLHLMLGSTYAWSIYRNPIMVQTGWDQSSVSFAFSLAIFCLGLSAAFMGRLVEKFGPRVTGSMSAVLYAGGNILTGVAIAQGELWILYLGYGILGGLGLGVGYITPVSTIIKWFPDKRGLAIMGFGFASLLTSPIAQYLIQARGVEQTFYILGVVYFVVMLFVSQFIKRPSVEEAQLLADKSPNRQAADLSKEVTANEALKSSTFYWLWLILFINISCGLALVSAISPMAQDMVGMSAESAAVVVGVMGIFNGFGRLLWAGLSDYIGRPKTFILLFVVNIVMAILLIVLQVPLVFVVAMAVLMTCYGAGFSLIPPYLSDIFGAKELATLHGYILTAWAMAALVGPMLLSVTYELTKSYQMTLLVFIALYVVALVIAYLLKKKVIRQSSLMMRI